MDTRTKIVSLEAALATPFTAVAGTFDVLTFSRIERVQRIAASSRKQLIAIVTDRPGTLLPLRARAELAASLAAIGVVVAVEGPLDAVRASLHPDTDWIDLLAEDDLRTAELIRYIHQRNGVLG